MNEPRPELLTDISHDLKFWWRQNRTNPTFFGGERAYEYRLHAERQLFELHEELDPEYKIQFVAGKKAVQLYMLSSSPYDHLEVTPARDEHELKPGEALDLTAMRKNVLYPGKPTEQPVMFAGQVFYTPSLAIGESLVEGGLLQFAPQDTEETHFARIQRS